MSAFMSAALSLLTNDVLAWSAAAQQWRMMEDDFSPNYKLHTGDPSNTQIHLYMWAHTCAHMYLHTLGVWKWHIIQRMGTCRCFYRCISYILMQNTFQSTHISSTYTTPNHICIYMNTRSIQYYRNVCTTLQQVYQKHIYCMYHVTVSLALV